MMPNTDPRFVRKRGSVANKAPDRRVQRTRKLLQDAMISMIIEKGYDATTVQDIIDRANVGRATFYAHFADKETLLHSRLEDLRGFLRDEQRRHPGSLGFSLVMLEHARDNLPLWQKIAGRQSGAFALQRIERLVADLASTDLKALGFKGPPEERQLAAEFIAGAFMAVLWSCVVCRLNCGWSGAVDPPPNGLDVPHRSNLHAAGVGPGELRRDADRLVHVLGLDQVEAREHFLRLGKRSIHDRLTAVADAYRLGGRRALEHLGIEQLPVLAQLVGMREAVAHLGVELPLRERVEELFVGVDQDDEFHGVSG